MNWGSVAVDEARQLMVVNTMHLPFVVRMIPREEDAAAAAEGGLNAGYGIGGPQRGTAYAARVQQFASPIGLPCLQPPYGEIAVVDLTRRQIAWRRALGVGKLGFPYAAGSIVTAGGVVFMGGVVDGRVRAFDALTGEILWEEALPAGSDATPMTYVSPKSGRQFLVVTVPGESRPAASAHQATPAPGTTAGGRVIAWALPAAED